MKKGLLIAIALLPACIFAQEIQYSISGKVGAFNAPAKVYLLLQNGRVVKDSVALKNGAFELKGTDKAPRQAMLLLDAKGIGYKSLLRSGSADVFEFYIDNAKMTLAAKDSVSKAVIKGSALNTDFAAYKKQVSPAEAKVKAVVNEYNSASKEQRATPEFQADMDKKYDAASTEVDKIQKDFIKANPNTMVSLDLIKSGNEYSMEDVAATEALFNGLSDAVKSSVPGKAYKEEIDKYKTVAVGAVAPDFAQTTPDGKTIKVSDYKGKYLLVDFWASWCGPCRRENPNVVKAYQAYKDKNFTILGVSLDDEKGKDAWLKAIEKDQLVWDQVSDLKGWNNEAAKLYLVRSIPQNFLLDPDGKIIAHNLRGEDLAKKLEEIFR